MERHRHLFPGHYSSIRVNYGLSLFWWGESESSMRPVVMLLTILGSEAREEGGKYAPPAQEEKHLGIDGSKLLT